MYGSFVVPGGLFASDEGMMALIQCWRVQACSAPAPPSPRPGPVSKGAPTPPGAQAPALPPAGPPRPGACAFPRWTVPSLQKSAPF
jgi:hypothetical protein